MSSTPLTLSTPTLTGIPLENKQQIIANLDVPSRLNLRNVSKTFRMIGDTTPFSIDLLYIGLYASGEIFIKADSFFIHYLADNGRRFANFGNSRIRSLGNTEPIMAAMTDLATLLSIENLEIKKMRVFEQEMSFEWNLQHFYWNRIPHPPHAYLYMLEGLLKSLDHKLKVHTLVLGGVETDLHVDCLFPFLNPESIKVIQFTGLIRGNWLTEITVSHFDLWKAATSFIMPYENGLQQRDLPHFVHFNNVNMIIIWDRSKPIAESVEGLIQILLQNQSLEQFVLNQSLVGSDSKDLRDHFGVKRTAEVVVNYPNSANKLRFIIQRDSLFFKGPKYVEKPVEYITID